MLRVGVGLGLVGLGLTACGETTVDTVATTVPADSVPPTTAPTGSTDDLLDRLVDETATLSETIVENEGDDETLARIEVLWTAARPGIEEARPDLLPQFDAAMDYARRAVERRRPADADKAALNLRTLADEL